MSSWRHRSQLVIFHESHEWDDTVYLQDKSNQPQSAQPSYLMREALLLRRVEMIALPLRGLGLSDLGAETSQFGWAKLFQA